MGDGRWWLEVSPQEYVRLIEGNLGTLERGEIGGTAALALGTETKAMQLLAISKLGEGRFEKLLAAVKKEYRDGGMGTMDGGV